MQQPALFSRLSMHTHRGSSVIKSTIIFFQMQTLTVVCFVHGMALLVNLLSKRHRKNHKHSRSASLLPLGIEDNQAGARGIYQVGEVPSFASLPPSP
jgi:hypothetical protein